MNIRFILPLFASVALAETPFRPAKDSVPTPEPSLSSAGEADKPLPAGFRYVPRGNPRAEEQKGIFFGETTELAGTDVEYQQKWLLVRVKDSKGAWRPGIAGAGSKSAIFLGDSGPEFAKESKSLEMEYLYCDAPETVGLSSTSQSDQNTSKVWSPWLERLRFPANAICLGKMSILGRPAAEVYAVRLARGFGFVIKDNPDTRPTVFFRLTADGFSSGPRRRYDSAGLPLTQLFNFSDYRAVRVLTSGKL